MILRDSEDQERGNGQRTKYSINFQSSSGHEKLIKPSHQEMARSKPGHTGRGVREANKGKTTHGGGGEGAKLLKTNMAATTLRTSAPEDL